MSYKKCKLLFGMQEEDVSYLGQEWADSAGLATSLQGTNNIKWRPC